uniref:ATP-dependent DNA helicase n=1 Tax=Solanum tuberosum TaxID=4113 RepID=M1B701_SOLTU
MDTNMLFGGKVIVFGGDFRQTLPVIQNGKKEGFINESLLNSNIRNQLEKYQLVQNMRAKTDPTFCEYLLKIGDGKETVNDFGKIEIPQSFLIPFINEKESLDILFKAIHPNLNMVTEDISSITSRVILKISPAPMDTIGSCKRKIDNPVTNKKDKKESTSHHRHVLEVKTPPPIHYNKVYKILHKLYHFTFSELLLPTFNTSTNCCI